jgi:hypothetical protein
MRHCRLLLLMAGAAALAHSQQILSVAGNVSVRAADDAPWTAAAAGMALALGTSVSVGPKAMAEIRVDASDSFAAAANSHLKLAGIENGKYRLELTGGKITYQAADPAVDALRVNLLAVAVEPVEPGIYAIAHAPGGQSEITVQAGLARVVAPTGSELVIAGQKMLVRYTANGPEFRVVSAFSRWRRFLTVAGAAIQIAANISAAGGSAAPPAKTVAVHPRTTSNTPSAPTSRERSDLPTRSGSPPPQPPSKH